MAIKDVVERELLAEQENTPWKYGVFTESAAVSVTLRDQEGVIEN